MIKTPSRIVNRTLPRRIKSYWKRFGAVFSSPNILDNGAPILRARRDSVELRLEQLSTSPVVDFPVDPVYEAGVYLQRLSDTDSEYKHLPKVTISATTETGQPELSIKVPKQRKYSGRMPAISSTLAGIPCAALGVQGVLDRLNVTLGTSHTLDTPSVVSVLKDCIAKNYDFGTAYGHLRGIWVRNNVGRTIKDELHTREEEDKKRRQEALVGDLMERSPPPRRMWDLCSNRVVPWWITEKRPKPISHAWVDEKDRMDMWTPINGKEWPVPIPKDTSLDLIRIEMLNLGVEYTWLDVLCLRQKGGPSEDLRVEEWKLDVPTIGQAYKGMEVAIYLSGLGRPLTLKAGDLESDRCWFRRAWTLQEVGYWRTIAGDTPDGPMHAKHKGRKYETEILTEFHKKLKHIEETTYPYCLFSTLADMRTRVSTNPMDRVAGLAFCLQASRAYHESETEENAWAALVNAMDPHMRGCILFLYPGAGLGGKKWRPTWEQVMSESLPADVFCLTFVSRDDETDEDCYQGTRIEEGLVRGLDVPSTEGVDRCGELVINDADGMQLTFNISVAHHFSIPEGAYTLLGDADHSSSSLFGLVGGESEFWVVGRSLPDQRFEKLCVITIPDTRARERLDRCGVVQRDRRTYLL